MTNVASPTNKKFLNDFVIFYINSGYGVCLAIGRCVSGDCYKADYRFYFLLTLIFNYKFSFFIQNYQDFLL